jgi:hypothetical protein
MADTPEIRAAEALKLAPSLLVEHDRGGSATIDAGILLQAHDLLQALATDVKELVGDYLEVQALRGEDLALIRDLMAKLRAALAGLETAG